MQDDEQEIRQLVSTWMAATKAGDVETVLSLMADDVIFLVPGQPVMRKAGFAAAARAQAGPDGPKFDGSSEIQEIKILGDWAFMWARLIVVVTPPGGAPSVLVGPLRKARGIRVDRLGVAIAMNVLTEAAGVETLQWDDFMRLSRGIS